MKSLRPLLLLFYTSVFVQTPSCLDLIKLQSGVHKKKKPSFHIFASK